jgi:hypothetical protein
VAKTETRLAQTARHVREGEARVARQLALIKKLDASGRHEEAALARNLLATLTEALDLARRHLHRLTIEKEH